MQLTVHQSIYIHLLKVENVTNSSVLQIGSSGKMQALSQLYNTGEFETLAEEAEIEGAQEPLVPLSPT
ncbi:spore germination protein GerPB [Gracilibacillus sp. YIM 98692]|uniref:spore germination protein GerPB n=1 Tax=Gracilibacillus sp. YIM 98692 TaxID=2663532 RepID=UPI0013D30AAD|nr:spore germination protein GerPB [Gracilibacillus sp. YIM 98692]